MYSNYGRENRFSNLKEGNLYSKQNYDSTIPMKASLQMYVQ